MFDTHRNVAEVGISPGFDTSMGMLQHLKGFRYWTGRPPMHVYQKLVAAALSLAGGEPFLLVCRDIAPWLQISEKTS